VLLIGIASFRKTLVVEAATRLKGAIEQPCLWLARKEAVCEGLQHWASLQRTHVP
jgi:hypothetical protein